MCRRRLGVLLVGMTVAMFLAAGPAATKVGAQEALIEADPLVVKARADLQATQAAAHVAAADLERTTEQRGYYQSERSYGSFYRSIPLPEGVQAESATAEFKDGVLQIEIPAPQRQSHGRKLEIKG